MPLHGNVDPEVVDEYDSRLAQRESSSDLGRAHAYREQRCKASGLGLAALLDHQATRARKVECVHEIHALLAERFEQSLYRGRAERLRVELEDRARVGERELRGPIVEELCRERSE